MQISGIAKYAKCENVLEYCAISYMQCTETEHAIILYIGWICVEHNYRTPLIPTPGLTQRRTHPRALKWTCVRPKQNHDLPGAFLVSAVGTCPRHVNGTYAQIWYISPIPLFPFHFFPNTTLCCLNPHGCCQGHLVQVQLLDLAFGLGSSGLPWLKEAQADRPWFSPSTRPIQFIWVLQFQNYSRPLVQH